MIAEAINKILNLAPIEKIIIQNRDYTSRQVYEARPDLIDNLKVHSLQAIVDFYEMKGDICTDDTMIHIVDPRTVRIVESTADDIYRTREHFLTAEWLGKEFNFGSWYQPEDMVLRLLALFDQSETRQALMDMISGGIRSVGKVEVTDNGISQDVTFKTLISTRKDRANLENPMQLTPIRTFTEITQVASPYVLRIRYVEDGKPEIAIFDSGGGQWKNDAITRIKGWLSERIEGVKIIG